MGTLVVKAYPTKLFRNAADHTYVECGTGAVGWSCWGGKTGGRVVRQAEGSTLRADAIAEPNECAGVTCYGFNGVCHQAANRILLPAKITVMGVRGYQVSNALFGTYGRASIWRCRAPFNQHPTVTGDLPACVPPPPVVPTAPRSDLDDEDAQYVAGVLSIYSDFDRLLVTAAPPEERRTFHLQLFSYMVDFYLGSGLGDRRQQLLEVRLGTEQRQQNVEEQVTSEGVLTPQLIEEINGLTLDFQANLAQVTTDDEYERLLQLPKAQRIVLLDADVIDRLYG